MNDSTRLRLITAARDIFADKGFDAASVREITSAADANLAAITYHFGSKEALYDAVLEHTFEPVASLLRKTLHEGPLVDRPPLDRIEALVRGFLGRLDSAPKLPLLILHQAIRREGLPGPTHAKMQEVIGTLASLIREGQGDGTIRDGDAQLMALSIWAQPVYFGLIRCLAPAIMQGDASAIPSMESRSDHIVRFIRRGLVGDQGE
jgi:AcrR family transcriptional regulator